MFTHVIFDLDGTLLDTLEDLANSANWICAQHGWPEHPVENFKYYVGNGAMRILACVVPKEVDLTRELHQALYEEYSVYYDAHKADNTCPYPGLPELLAQLKEKGSVTAVLTNKPHIAAQPVVDHYYPGLLTAVQGAVPGVPTKPDPTALYNLMERIGAKRETTLFVGDSNVDIKTARNGGLKSCGVLWGFRTRQELADEGADFLAEDAQELADVIYGKD